MDYEQGNGRPPADFKRARRQRESLVDPAKVDREIPASEESERAVLGCCLIDPKKCIGVCIEKFTSSDVFYSLVNRTIYECLLAMYNDNVPVEVRIVIQELKDLCQLEGVGGIAYVASLPDTTPSAENLDYYVQILLEKWTLRKMIALGTEVVSRAYEHQGEVDLLVEEVDRDIRGIVDGVQQNHTTPPFKVLIRQAIDQIESRHQQKGAIGGLSTGFPDLDKLCDGLHPGLNIIAARPGLGKTSIAMNIVEHVVLELGLPVGVFSLQMTGSSLAQRMISSVARVNFRSIRDGFLSERDFTRLATASGRLNKALLFIDDESSLSIMKFRAKARRMHQQHGIKLLVLDYIQLLSSPGRKKENRQQEVADVSQGVKALSKELAIPILALAQLNRDVEKEKGRRPRLSDLKESGQLEADGDLVGMLYKPKPEGEDKEELDAVPMTLTIAKQRMGACGDIFLTFVKGITRFESSSRIDTDDIPETNQPYADR